MVYYNKLQRIIGESKIHKGLMTANNALLRLMEMPGEYIDKKKLENMFPSKNISIDKAIEKASKEARNAVLQYQKADNINMKKELDEIWATDNFVGIISEHMTEGAPGEGIVSIHNSFIPPQINIASTTDNIVVLLNRSSQLLYSKLATGFEMPKTYTSEEFIKESSKRHKKIERDGFDNRQYRVMDTMLFASNMILFTNNLDSNLFKQTASTLYDKYDYREDKMTMTVKKLQEQLKTDYSEIYERLFGNGFEELKNTLVSLRNTIGHSEIGQKITVPWGDNPQILYNGKRQDAYPVIQKISLAYLDKTTQLYRALSDEIILSGRKPFVENYMKKYLETYHAEGVIRMARHDKA